MGDSYVKTDENKEKLVIDANTFYGLSMCESLPHDEIKFDKKVELEGILDTPVDSDMGYFIEVYLRHPVEI